VIIDSMNYRAVDGVSIVIPTYNRARLLGPTLESVKRLRVPERAAIEVVVIDNNCTDNTPRVVEEAARDSDFPIRRILETQQGLCHGRNRGLKEARYQHLVYLDDDIEVAEDWLPGYFEAIEQLDADCVVGPVFPKFEREPPDFLTERVLDSVTSTYSRRGDCMNLLPREVAHEVPGCNFGIRKSVALDTGGFNNNLDRIGVGLLAGGDWEFGLRLVAAGRQVVYQPRCAIRHIITADKLSRRNLRKRWAGLGATERTLQKPSDSLSLSPWIRHFRRVVRLFAASVVYRLRGDIGVAFQRELEARRRWAYLKADVLQHHES
jgi:glucosyl-dolichyl phosphate glucuronosyltransferase